MLHLLLFSQTTPGWFQDLQIAAGYCRDPIN